MYIDANVVNFLYNNTLYININTPYVQLVEILRFQLICGGAWGGQSPQKLLYLYLSIPLFKIN